MSEKTVPQPSVSYDDIRWINQRLDRLDKKIRIVIAIMVDKKLVSDEIAKVIMETKEENAKILEWYLKKLKE